MDLRNLKRASQLADAQSVFANLRANQELERNKIEEQIAEKARCLDSFNVHY